MANPCAVSTECQRESRQVCGTCGREFCLAHRAMRQPPQGAAVYVDGLCAPCEADRRAAQRRQQAPTPVSDSAIELVVHAVATGAPTKVHNWKSLYEEFTAAELTAPIRAVLQEVWPDLHIEGVPFSGFDGVQRWDSAAICRWFVAEASRLGVQPNTTYRHFWQRQSRGLLGTKWKSGHDDPVPAWQLPFGSTQLSGKWARPSDAHVLTDGTYRPVQEPPARFHVGLSLYGIRQLGAFLGY